MRTITVAGVRRRLSRARAAASSSGAAAREWNRRRGPRSPVDLRDWLDRRSSRTIAEFPDRWRIRERIMPDVPARVVVVLHAFYPELVGELLAALAVVPVEFDLIVTNASGAAVEVDATQLPRLRHVVVLEVDNHGRDIWPLVQVINAGLLDPYEIVLKVHTKHSPWRAEHADLAGSGQAWREDLLAGLLGDRANVEAILGGFAENLDLGLVAATGNILGPEFWGADLAITQELLRRVELTVEPDGLRFPAGSFYWTRAFVLQGLRSLALTAQDFDAEAGQIDGTTAHAIERSIGLLAAEAGLGVLGREQLPAASEASWRRYRMAAPRQRTLRAVPFYLPQFHPTPENDMFWGAGFTEWTNVTSARPVYEGHNQPNLPADLGFYDLRLDDVRRDQSELAAAFGVDGFMYYYYWFAGKRLLHRPIDALLRSDINKSFCLMWANENWTRRWDGRTDDVLVGQDYDRVPAEAFIDDVLPLLADPRYLRISDKPVLAVYRIAQIPNFEAVVEHWRRRAREAGVGELCVLSVDVAREFDGLAGRARTAGLDGRLGFPPHNLRWEWVPHGGLHVDSRFKGNLLSYQAMVADAEKRLVTAGEDFYPGVMVTFDNTARRQWASDVWFGANPYTFRRWLAAARSAVAHRPPEERIVFINAWNEWAEAAVLEPTVRFGRTYLQAVRDVVFG